MLVIKGKVDDWRVQRQNAYLIHCSLVEDRHRVSMTEGLPLPFDSEISEREKVWSEDEVKRIEQEYADTVRMWNEDDPFKKK